MRRLVPGGPGQVPAPGSKPLKRKSSPPPLGFERPEDCYATIKPDLGNGWTVTLHTGPRAGVLARWTFTKHGARRVAQRLLRQHRRRMVRGTAPEETIR